jgi:ribosomal protein S18 acetylase RimI-like enzyme
LTDSGKLAFGLDDGWSIQVAHLFPLGDAVLDSSLLDAATSVPSEAPRIHLASPADVPFIVEAIADASREGHFACDCDRPDVLSGLWHQVQTVVVDGVMPLPGERDGANGRAFVIQVGQANAGFAILVEDRPGSWHRRLELFALGVRPGHRGRGLGRQLVTNLVRDSQSACVYARCAFASVGMAGMLKSCGFELGAQSTPGGMTLELHR